VGSNLGKSLISGYTEDLPAQAKTGSGKTPAFGIGLLHILNVKRFRVQALVMCPTREVAEQVAGELRRIVRFKHNIKIVTICGGVPVLPQQISLKHQGHYVAIERIMADKDNY
jgi:ATP-independent RNA helicase DbpA